MIIIATIETIDGSTFDAVEVEATDYAAGFTELRASVPEGRRLISVRVQR